MTQGRQKYLYAGIKSSGWLERRINDELGKGKMREVHTQQGSGA